MFFSLDQAASNFNEARLTGTQPSARVEKVHLKSKAKCFPNHVTQHFRVLERHLTGRVTEGGLVVEAKEGGEDGKGGPLPPFPPKQLSFHLFNTKFLHKNLEEKGGFR